MPCKVHTTVWFTRHVTEAATTAIATISSAATISEQKSTVKTGTKRKKQDLIEPRRSKRKAYSKTSDTTLATKAGTSESVAATAVETPMDLSKTIYKCYECIHKWAKEVQRKFPRYWDASVTYLSGQQIFQNWTLVFELRKSRLYTKILYPISSNIWWRHSTK